MAQSAERRLDEANESFAQAAKAAKAKATGADVAETRTTDQIELDAITAKPAGQRSAEERAKLADAESMTAHERDRKAKRLYPVELTSEPTVSERVMAKLKGAGGAAWFETLPAETKLTLANQIGDKELSAILAGHAAEAEAARAEVLDRSDLASVNRRLSARQAEVEELMALQGQLLDQKYKKW